MVRSRPERCEALHTGLADDTGVALVLVKVGGNVLPQFLEDKRAAGEMKPSEARVVDRLRDDRCWGAWDELNDTGRDTGFNKDLVNNIVGVSCGGGWFPDNHVANESRGYIICQYRKVG